MSADPLPEKPAWALRGEATQARVDDYRRDLGAYYDALSARLKKDAPYLYDKLRAQPPSTARYGYGLLPHIKRTAAPAPGAAPARAESHRYSWPWTDAKVDAERARIARSRGEFASLEGLGPAGRHAVEQRLVTEYPSLRDAQRNIDDHVHYNRLWQAAIAGGREAYDRSTALHDAAVERQALLDAFAAPDDASFRRALAAVPGVDAARPRPELEPVLRAREAELASRIHEATDRIDPPAYAVVRHPSAHRWIVEVPVRTDIADRAFLAGFREAVERVWHVRDGADEYRVEIAFEPLPARELYRRRPGCATGTEADCDPPARGEHIDVDAHAALFPRDAAALTTGAAIPHTIHGVVVLGSGEVGAHLLAHEFGHVLGFRDEYFRGYRDLGADGFLVMEVLADPRDVMGNPDSGPVRAEQMRRLVEAIQARDAGHDGPAGRRR